MRNWLAPQARERLQGLAARRIGVVGLGREGEDLARSLTGWGAQVVVSDQAEPETLQAALGRLHGLPIRYLLGHQEGHQLLDCDEVFVSPGVPRQTPVVAEAARSGIAISSATRLFFELCPGRIAGITGSNGKTTTTSLVGEILRSAGKPILVGGNIGLPLLGRLNELSTETWCVLELSSFQLEDMLQSPPVGVVLNITPNHLDRHADMDEYIHAKGNIVRFQSPADVAVLNADDPTVTALPCPSAQVLFSLHPGIDGAWLEGEQLMVGGAVPIWREARSPIPTLSRLDPRVLIHRDELKLRGMHNTANALAAAATALTMGCPAEKIADALRRFETVPHRLEIVRCVDSVVYVNDSIGTSPERSMAALRAFTQAVVLIAGGRDKHLPMDAWASLIGERARAVVLVGEAASKIQAALAAAGAQVPIAQARSFAEVVPLAQSLAQPGDAVLLSPGCTSFDEFRDFEARGEAFRTAVEALGGDPGC